MMGGGSFKGFDLHWKPRWGEGKLDPVSGSGPVGFAPVPLTGQGTKSHLGIELITLSVSASSNK